MWAWTSSSASLVVVFVSRLLFTAILLGSMTTTEAAALLGLMWGWVIFGEWSCVTFAGDLGSEFVFRTDKCTTLFVVELDEVAWFCDEDKVAWPLKAGTVSYPCSALEVVTFLEPSPIGPFLVKVSYPPTSSEFAAFALEGGLRPLEHRNSYSNTNVQLSFGVWTGPY